MNAIKNVKVDIIMTTYNQSLYIKQAIESVLSQKCSFGFLLIVVDDCSTDDSFEVISAYKKRYPDIILTYRNSTNIGLAANYEKAFSFSTAKYIAILEGDDFYTDTFKLQKQFDILEGNEAIGIVHSNYSVLRADGTIGIGHGFKNLNTLQGDLFKSLLISNSICPATVLMRGDIVKQYVDFNFATSNFLKTIDLFLWLEICIHKKVYYQNEITSCYRILQTSVSNSSDPVKVKDFVQTSVKILEYYIDKKIITDTKRRLILGNAYYPLIVLMLKLKMYPEARELSNQLYLKSIKQLWIWLLVNSAWLRPVFNLQAFFLQLGSKVKQATLKIIRGNNG